MNSGIYIISNIINNKVYVGSAVNIDKRTSQHFSNLKHNRHDNIHLQRSWNKHGKEAFKFEIIFYCLKEDLIENEQLVIDSYREVIGWKNMYNIAPIAGSQLGMIHSQATKDKMSKANGGHPGYWLGKKFTLETRMKMSISRKGRNISEETCKKISKALKGRKQTPEHVEKVAAANRGRKHSIETRKKMSESRKKYLIEKRK
jgi:group I intron endonuclease